MSPMLSMQESRDIFNFDSSTHAETIMIPKRQTQTLLTHARCKVFFFFFSSGVCSELYNFYQKDIVQQKFIFSLL